MLGVGQIWEREKALKRFLYLYHDNLIQEITSMGNCQNEHSSTDIVCTTNFNVKDLKSKKKKKKETSANYFIK